MRMLKRLIFPLILMSIFVWIGMVRQDLHQQFGAEALDRQRRLIFYVLQIGLFVSVAFFVDRLIKVLFWDGIVAKALGGPVPALLKTVGTVVILTFCVTGIVAVVFGQSITGIWATSGAIGLVVGLALQSIILDVFSGLAINVDRGFRIGDWIQLHNRNLQDSIIGEIIQIKWRTTHLRTKENNTLIVPNSVMGTSMVMNYSAPSPESRFYEDFCLDFSVPAERALRVLTAGVRGSLGGGLLSEPGPAVRIKTVTPIGVVYEMRYWIRANEISPSKARNRVLASTLEHLRQAGLSLAYPKEDVFHQEMPVRQLEGLTLEDRMTLLRKTSLFESLGEEELRQLAGSMTRRFLREKDVLLRRGDAGESMFILVEGLLDVYIDKGNGEEIRVASVNPGRFLGEMSLLTGEPRSATLLAATECVLFEITRRDVTDLIRRRPELAEMLSRAVAEHRLRDDRSRNEMSDRDKEKQTSSVAEQIMAKMRSFFRGVLVGDDDRTA